MISTERSSIVVNGTTIKLHKVTGKASVDVIAEMKRLSMDDHPRNRLPGPNPVSLERSEMYKLKSGYVVAEKTDGIRFMLCCMRLYDIKLCVIIDRAMSVYLLPLQCIPRVLFQGSIFDGEVTVDKSGTPVFVFFDAVVVSGITVSQLPLDGRIIAMQRSMKSFRAHPNDPVKIMFKKWIPLDAPDVRERLAKTESTYHCDGVVLVPVADPVVYGRNFHFYKLKPEGTHTVDFVILDGRGTIGIYDPEVGKNVPVGKIDMSKKLFLVGTIVECAYENGSWHALHDRPDKLQANDLLTFKKTRANIDENIKFEEIIKFVQS